MSNVKRRTKIESLTSRRRERVCNWLAWQQSDQRRRLEQTRKLFGTPVVVIDPHTHSEHSDGCATAAVNRDAGAAAGLDIVFATDHGSLAPKRFVHNMDGMSWGQEPGALHHHIGLLCNRRLFRPRRDSLADDFRRARDLAPFVWIPHPAGWYPGTYYSEEKKNALWTLAPAFAMEVLNGAHRIGTAFDQFDREAVAVWDRLLSDGIRVTPLGASDAHVPESIGCCWTALPGAEADVESVIEGLNAGRCLASEGPLLSISVDGRPMGASVCAGRRLTLKFRAVDAAGLQCIRIVAGGRALKTIYARDEVCVEGEWAFNPGSRQYVRIEARAVDNRRAFSSPVYIVK